MSSKQAHELSQFTSDWVTGVSHMWEKHLLPVASGIVHILEIGSYEGRSACWFINNLLTHPASRLTCIDKWSQDVRERTFDHNMVLTGKSNQVRKIKTDWYTGLTSLAGERFDLIYIDADHTARSALSQAVITWPMLRPGGLMLFDDYEWNKPDVADPPKEGIDAFLHLWGAQMDVVHKAYQVLVRKRPN